VRPQRFEPSALAPLEILASIPAVRDDPRATLALESLRARMASSTHEKSLRFARATGLLGASLELETVLQNVLDAAVSVTNAERGFLMLADRSIVARHAFDAAPYAAPSQSIVEAVFTSGEALFTTDAQSDPRWRDNQSIAALHLRSIACMPLHDASAGATDEPVGAIYLDSRVVPGLFTPYDREHLGLFSRQAARAIVNAQHATEQRDNLERISELKTFQSRILETIASGVITLDAEGRVSSFNAGAEKTFGVAAEHLVGRGAAALDGLIPEFGELLETFVESGTAHLRAEASGLTPLRPLALELRLWPLETATGPGVAIVVADVTKHRTIEDAHAAQVVRATVIAESFSRYLAPHVVASLMANPASVRLGGERTPATMLFADVRGFTQLAATAAPERVVEILNGYFEEAVKIVFEHDGLLDKFYGDGLMAVFGPPRVREDDAERALRAARRLLEVVRELGPRLDYPLAISIGLATGEVIAGHFGATRRMDYTVIGDAVNLASGLQSAAPAGSIYIDEPTYRRAGTSAVAFRRQTTPVKGRSGPTVVYTLET